MKRFLPLFVLMAGCAGYSAVPSSIISERLTKPPPPPQDIPTPSKTFALELITRRKYSGVTMTAFNTGTMRVRGEVVSSMKSWHAKLKLDVPAFLIKHPREGAILFDTGLSRQAVHGSSLLLSVVDPAVPQFTSKKGQDLVAQLSRAGVSTDSVKWVILSSLAPERAGMAAFFENATVVVSRAEWEWRKARVAGDEAASIALTVLEPRLKLVDIDARPACGPIVHCLDLFDDGTLYLADLAGRTPGTMGALAMLDGGPVMLAGGAAFVVDNYLDLSLPLKSQVEDLTLYWRSLHVLRALREAVPQAVVLPGNDLRPLKLAGRSDVPAPDFRAKKASAEERVKPNLRR
jgi:glyoxylase-like metal-dependent hydrolase (beta-lactamase superfamily II)